MGNARISGLSGVLVFVCLWFFLEVFHVSELPWTLMLPASAAVGLIVGLAFHRLRKVFKF